MSAENKIPDSLPSPRRVASVFVGSLTYPNAYMWFVFLSAMDVMVTTSILYLGGREVNPIADAVIQRFGTPGMVVYKFIIVAVIVIICEFVGRRKRGAGRVIAYCGVGLTMVPVLLGLSLLPAAIDQFLNPPTP